MTILTILTRSMSLRKNMILARIAVAGTKTQKAGCRPIADSPGLNSAIGNVPIATNGRDGRVRMNKMAESAHRENLLSAVSASKETDDPSMRAVITLAKSLGQVTSQLESMQRENQSLRRQLQKANQALAVRAEERG